MDAFLPSRKDLTRRATAQSRAMGGDRAFLRECCKRFASPLAFSRPFEVDDVLHRDDALGIIYQSLNAPKLERAYRATTTQKRKFTNDEIPAVTGLFTPRWVVEVLLQNTLGRTWMDMHPDSRLRDTWQFLRSTDVPSAAKRTRACDLTILDPACGTMNFGLVAIKMLDAMYREELDRAGEDGWPDPSVRTTEEIAESIARHNLFGIDIDPIALELASVTLARKLCGETVTHLHRGDALFEDLPHDWPRTFDVVVTNPPYLTARNLHGDLVGSMKKRYPRAWRDQGTCFIERCLELTATDGRTGLLTMQTFMFTAAYESLRRHLIERTSIETLAHLGPGVFDVGNPGTLQTVAFTMRNESPDATHKVFAYRCVDHDDKPSVILNAAENDKQFQRMQRDWHSTPRAAFVYWLDNAYSRTFSILPKLGDIAPPRQGLATTDNARFVRYWWEVTPTCAHAPIQPPADTWFPYVKSGRFRRWYESPRHRVNWRDDGAEIKQAIVERYPYLNGKWQWVAKNAKFYFRAGVTYSYLTSGTFSARKLDEGAIFDVAGSSLFPDDALTMLAILNSPAARRLLHAINPTVNFQVGDLRELPVPSSGTDAIRRDVERAVELVRTLDTFDQTAPDFERPLPWRDGRKIWECRHGDLQRVEHRIFDAVADLYDVPREMEHSDAIAPYDALDHARRCVDAALREVLIEKVIARLTPLDPSVTRAVRARLSTPTAIDKTLGGVGRFLSSSSYEKWHTKLYRGKPVVRIFGEEDRRFAVLYDFATEEVVRTLDTGGQPVPRATPSARSRVA